MTNFNIDDLAERTSDAYSYDRYRSWRACVRLLHSRGFNEREAEAILRSKWMRWASDASSYPYGKATTGDLARFLDSMSTATVASTLLQMHLASVSS